MKSGSNLSELNVNTAYTANVYQVIKAWVEGLNLKYNVTVKFYIHIL